jgi:lysophospholipase L1-like esterase
MINYLKFKKYFRMEPISCSTWASTQALLAKECNPPIDLSNNSLRQIFKISIGGERFRIKITNKYGNDSLEIKSISIASINSQGAGQIELNTLKKITFGNNGSISISKGEEINTDIIDYHLPSSSEVAISIFFGKVPSNITGHKFSITNSFIETGNKINEEKFSINNKTEHWYFISNIDVITNKPIKGLICFGDSITDGRFSSIDKQERWPDFLYKKLKNKHIDIAINNQGLSGSSLSKEGMERFENDVLKQNGAKYLIVLYGINDITKLNLNENLIIDLFKKIIEKAHKVNMLVFGGTLTPFKGYRLYTEEKNTIRNKVNEWIRNCKKIKDGFDEYIDFDLVVRDENDIAQIKKDYNSGDGAHFNSLGYEKMTEAFNDLSYFNNYTFNFE